MHGFWSQIAAIFTEEYGSAFSLKDYFLCRGRLSRRHAIIQFFTLLILFIVIFLGAFFFFVAFGYDFNQYGFVVVMAANLVIFSIAMVSIGIRRLHDLNCRGWWILFPLFAYLAAIIFFLTAFALTESSALQYSILAAAGISFMLFFFYLGTDRGTLGENRFGRPLYEDAREDMWAVFWHAFTAGQVKRWWPWLKQAGHMLRHDYVTVKGRLTPREYFYHMVLLQGVSWGWNILLYFVTVIMMVVSAYLPLEIDISVVSDYFDTVVRVMNILIVIAVLLMQVTLEIRRLHDFGNRGWLVLLYLVPLINLFFFLRQYTCPGERQDNHFGVSRNSYGEDDEY